MKYQVKIRVETGAICYRAIRPMMDLYSFEITKIYRAKKIKSKCADRDSNPGLGVGNA